MGPEVVSGPIGPIELELDGDAVPEAKAVVAAVELVTVITVEPVMPLSVAEMVEVPAATAVAKPAVVIVATAVVPEAHVTLLVRFCVDLSE
jgi:hypothetical protein